MLRAIPGLGVATPLSPILCPLHGRTGKVPRCAVEVEPDRANDASSDPITPILGAPECVAEFTEHFIYVTTRVATCVE